MNTVSVKLIFENRVYRFKGGEDVIDTAILRVLVDIIRRRVTQREQAYKSCGKCLHRQKTIDECRRRLKFIYKYAGDKEKALAALIRLMPLLKEITPPNRSEHLSSYLRFLNEVNRWILKSYQDE